MPHEPGHNGQYVIKSTGEPYNGPVLKTQSGEFYTTTTGALEGFDGVGPGGQLLVLASESTIQPPQQQTAVGDDNPVTRLFTAPATPRYYLPNGNLVSIGARLHQHQDGTIMTEHSMGPNDNSVVVTLAPPSNGQLMGSGLPGGLVPADPDFVPIQPPSPDRNTGGNTGGNMGGGGSY